jgi:hypothetical protein
MNSTVSGLELLGEVVITPSPEESSGSRCLPANHRQANSCITAQSERSQRNVLRKDGVKAEFSNRTYK